MTSIKKLAASSILLLFCATASGCYGQFALTRAIYDWNGRATPSKFANSALTWVMLIIPVYAVAGVVDFVVLNTVEFWSGRNPVVARADGSLVVERDGQRLAYRRRGDVVEVERDGVLAFRYFQKADGVVIEDAPGRTLKTLPASALASADVPAPR